MPGSPIPPNLNPAPPSSTGAAQSIEASSADWISTMTASGSASAPLQEQNLILIRLLERSTLTTATNTSAASTNRLNFTPNVNFTRTKSGSAASRYASEKDFPTLNSGTKKGSANAKSTANTASTTANPKKNSGSNKKASKKSSSKAKVPSDAAEAKKWALRLFSTPTAADTTDGDDMQMFSSSNTATSTLPPPGYTCVYLPYSHKTKHADLRTRLELLKINLKHVYAIQRPAKHVVSLLVHSHYAAEILKICEKEELHPITDFNPISGKNLGDPHLLKTLNAQQLDDKAKAIYYNRMLQATTQLREPRKGLAILKFFNALDSADNHHVPPVIIDEFIKLKPDCVRKISAAANTARSVLKGFDASNLFVSLTTSTNNADASISQPGSNPPPLTAASNAGSSPMDTNQ
ncbi:Methionine aminopeptidase 1 [Mucor velutinosus]|uniref:Methionine aminopeptidase 1 n=1 Tax=Mucor velutinosus TaxID=708070 RepID=A0AAN7DR03_9FUNG|nr:Methionine aminopeptidase 1 [Mucor velutinosus]